VADAVKGVVVDVPVVHDDRAVQVAVDEALEGDQVPVAEEVTGEQVGARDLQVLLAGLGPGADAEGGLVAADHPGEDDEGPDRLVRRRGRLRGALQQAVHPPVGRPGPGHRLDDVRAPLDGDVVHHHQEHAPGLEVQPVGHRARGARRFRRSPGDMPPAARALDLVPVVLDGLRPRLGQVGDLMGVAHPQVRGLSEILPAPADALREMRDRLVRVIVPRQVRPRRPRLLARPAPAAAAGLALLRLLPRLIIGARRHRRVPAVTRHQPLQPDDLLPQLPDQLVPLGQHGQQLIPRQLLIPGHHPRSPHP
jgi:hypothetical protein